jgi:hypothetical protein
MLPLVLQPCSHHRAVLEANLFDSNSKFEFDEFERKVIGTSLRSTGSPAKVGNLSPIEYLAQKDALINETSNETAVLWR